MNEIIKYFQILRLILLFLIICVLLEGWLSIGFWGFIDFPCFERYIETNNCIDVGGFKQSEDRDIYQIESFLTSYAAGFSGGGCYNEKSETNTARLQTDAANYLILERDDGILKVNGRILDKGAEFQAINVFYWNPWQISRLRFKNVGLVPDCGTNPENRRIVIIGSYGTEISLLKGFLILSFVIGWFIFACRKLKSLRTSSTTGEKLEL